MKGVILAGGSGSRLFPLTKVTNKHLLPVGNLPMIMHSIEKLKEINIFDIMIVTGTEHMGDIVSLLGSGKEYGCQFTYKVQDQPDGIAGALYLSQDFICEDSLCVILGDNIFEDNLEKARELFEKSSDSFKCLLNICEVKDPSRFGVPTMQEGKIIKIVEKPDIPESNYCVTGIYFYDKNVFRLIDKIKKSDRGEYEITDVNNLYLKNGIVKYNILKGWWTDAGEPDSYYRANSLVFSSKREMS
jgi:glucose-1-phosphate thymidylyltransferase